MKEEPVVLGLVGVCLTANIWMLKRVQVLGLDNFGVTLRRAQALPSEGKKTQYTWDFQLSTAAAPS